MADAYKNFAKGTVSTGYDASATSIALASGHGARFPQPSTDGSFNLVWWNSTQYSNPSDDPNVEIVRCTARSTDTLTITRAQEGTSATAKNTSGVVYSIILAITKKTWDDVAASLQVSMTAGETISAGDAVYVEDGTAVLTKSLGSQTRGYDYPAETYVSQSFTTSNSGRKIYAVTFTFYNLYVSGGAGNHNVYIRSGSETGTTIGSGTAYVGNGPGNVDAACIFSSPVDVSPNTTYWIVLQGSTSTNVYPYGGNTAGQGTKSSSSDSGYAATNGPLKVLIYEIGGTSGRVYKTAADVTARPANSNVLGFAASAGSEGNAMVVHVAGVVSGLSGLTAGNTYYLSNTPGAIGTSAGTVSKKIGIALSTTTLLIRHDNP